MTVLVNHMTVFVNHSGPCRLGGENTVAVSVKRVVKGCISNEIYMVDPGDNLMGLPYETWAALEDGCHEIENIK